MKKSLIATLLIGATVLPALQGCFPVVAAGVTSGVMATVDRRTLGVQTDDETIEWKANAQVSEKVGDKAHLNFTSYNRKVLLTGEAVSEEAKAQAEQIVGTPWMRSGKWRRTPPLPAAIRCAATRYRRRPCRPDGAPRMSIHLPCQLGSRARLAVLYALRVHRGGLSPDQLIRQTQLHPQTLSQALYGLHGRLHAVRQRFDVTGRLLQLPVRGPDVLVGIAGIAGNVGNADRDFLLSGSIRRRKVSHLPRPSGDAVHLLVDALDVAGEAECQVGGRCKFIETDIAAAGFLQCCLGLAQRGVLFFQLILVFLELGVGDA